MSDLVNLTQAYERLRVPPQKHAAFAQIVLAANFVSPKAVLRASQIVAKLSRVYPRKISFSKLRIDSKGFDDIVLIDWLISSDVIYTSPGSGKVGTVCTLTEEFAKTLPRGIRNV
jgi:hypothetical protein